MRKLPVLLLCGMATSLCWGQWKSSSGDKWEFSAIAGGSLFRDVTATNGSNSVHAGFGNGLAVGGVVAQTGGGHWGGEFHYLFETNHMRLKAGSGESGSAGFSAQSHTINYDVLLYAKTRESSIRPYAAFGPGLKVYVAKGVEQAIQPLGDVVVFTHQNETKFLFSGGGGVKVRLTDHSLVRFDFRDYVTGVPSNFTAVPGTKISGVFHNFVATVGIGITL